MNRTPQALQRVLGPSGPALHCGVFWAPQWVQRRSLEAAADGGDLGFRPRLLGFCCLSGGRLPQRRMLLSPAAEMWSVTRWKDRAGDEKEDAQEEEVVVVMESEEDSAKGSGLDTDQQPAAVRERLLRLALTGTTASVERTQTVGLTDEPPSMV